MAKHNYTQYSNKKKDEPIVDTVKMEVEETIETADVVVDLVEETVETVALPKIVEGVVVNCGKLNVRLYPSLTAPVVGILDVMSELEINVDESTGEWFKVCTATGIEGYCMRKFVDAYL